MARLVCSYPFSEHDAKLARIREVVREVTEGCACEPERHLHEGGLTVVTVRGMDDTLALQSKLSLEEDGVDPQVFAE